MIARFLPEADEELREAARYYEDNAPGLGFVFVAEVHRGVALIEKQPMIGSPLDDELRKLVLNRFPYSLIHLVNSEEIIITAGAHHRRRPYYWLKLT